MCNELLHLLSNVLNVLKIDRLSIARGIRP